MRVLNFFSVLLLFGVYIVSCASEKKVTNKQVRKDVWGHEESFTIGKDADGNPVMKSDKRSSFENKKSNLGKGLDFSGKDYTTKQYRTKRWGGNTHFAHKMYQGNTDANRYKKEPWFVRKQALDSGKMARDANKIFSTTPFKTGRAKEQSSRYSTYENFSVQQKRKNYGQPSITSWKKQKGLSVRDTNSMLGR